MSSNEAWASARRRLSSIRASVTQMPGICWSDEQIAARKKVGSYLPSVVDASPADSEPSITGNGGRPGEGIICVQYLQLWATGQWNVLKRRGPLIRVRQPPPRRTCAVPRGCLLGLGLGQRERARARVWCVAN